jgi:hypothetical protein
MATLFALAVDQFGLLNVATLDTAAGAVWAGPVPVGNASLVPGSPVAVVWQSTTVVAALAVDRNGLLNVATLDTAAGVGWEGPIPVGSAGLTSGCPIAVAKLSSAPSVALMIGAAGLIDVASLDTSSGTWQGPDPVGGAGFPPGGYVTTVTVPQ